MHTISRITIALIGLGTTLGTPLMAQGGRLIPRSSIRTNAVKLIDTVHVVRGSRVDTVTVRGEEPVSLKRGEIIVVSTGATAQVDSTPGDLHSHLDGSSRFIVLAQDGRELNLRLRVSFTGRGMSYDPVSRDFVGVMLIGLEDSLRRGQQLTLSTPIAVQVTGDADGYDPMDLSILHTNVPYARVKIRATSPKDTVRILVQPTFDPAGVHTPIPVARPPMQVRVSQPAIQGFGLQTAKVTISVTGAPEGLPVVVWSTRGRLDTDTLSLSAQGVASTNVRSEGLGQATVHAELGQLASGLVPIEYEVPWGFLVAAILGGLLGAFIRRRRDETKDKASRADLPLGVAFGLLGAVAYALGLNLTGAELSVRFGEAATFLIASLSAAFDLPGLEGLRAKLAPVKAK